MSSDMMPRTLTVTRVFDAPVEQAWRAWSDAEGVMQWWGPTGFTSPSAKMDFREGGTSLVCMRAPQDFGGQDFYNTWHYTKIVPMQSIDFIQNLVNKDGQRIDPTSVGLSPEMPQDARSVVTFKQLEGGKTEVTVDEYNTTSAQMNE